MVGLIFDHRQASLLKNLVAVNRAKLGGGFNDVPCVEGGGGPQDGVGRVDLVGKRFRKNRVVCVGRDTNHLAEVFNFLYCRLNQHWVMDNALHVIATQRHKKGKFAVEGRVHFDCCAHFVGRGLAAARSFLLKAELMGDDKGGLLYRLVKEPDGYSHVHQRRLLIVKVPPNIKGDKKTKKLLSLGGGVHNHLPKCFGDAGDCEFFQNSGCDFRVEAIYHQH